jgi:glutamate-1-semialdehyde 2,1-aminomutase
MSTAIERSDRTAALLTRAARVMPGGVLGTFVMPHEQELVMSHGEGPYVYDTDGNEFIDLVMGSGPLILGHAHPHVVAAARAQLHRGTQFYGVTEEAVLIAERLAAAIPCAEEVKLTSSGAEATFYALRLARAATGREKVLRFAGAYHGHHDYAAIDTSSGIPAAVAGTVLTATFNDLESAAEAIAANRDDLAAVIVEPLQRVVPPVPGFLEGLRELTAEHGIVLVFDELVTGFRLAWGGAQERYGVVPDMATYGKVIGGGLAFAAVAGPASIMELANPRKRGSDYVYFSGTLNGNPMGAAAGRATLEVLERPGTYEALNARGERLRAGLAQIAETLPFPLQVVGDGSLIGLVFADGDPTSPATVARSDKAVAGRVECALLRRGLFVNLAAKVYLATVHADDHVSRMLVAFEEALEGAAVR